MVSKALQKNQYYQAIDKTFKKTTIIAHVHHAKTRHKCTEGKQYPVTHVHCQVSSSSSTKERPHH